MRTRTALAFLGAAALLFSAVPAADASVSPNPTRPCAQPDGRVDAMAFRGSTLYLGGSFSHVVDRSGVSRVRGGLAAVDTASCDLTSWTSSADANVSALVVSGDKVYVAGSFTHVGGLARNRLAALDDSTAAVLPFN